MPALFPIALEAISLARRLASAVQAESLTPDQEQQLRDARDELNAEMASLNVPTEPAGDPIEPAVDG